MKSGTRLFEKLLKKLVQEEDRQGRFFSLTALAGETLCREKGLETPSFLKKLILETKGSESGLTAKERASFLSLLPQKYVFSTIREAFLENAEKKENGRFFTDRDLAEALLRNYQPGRSCPQVLDLCCGSGSLVMCLVEKLLAHFEKREIEEKVHAWDLDEMSLLALEMDLYFTHGLQLKEGNVKKINVLTQDLGGESFDLILLNPPYIGSRESVKLHPCLKGDSRFRAVYKRKSDISYCFYPLAASLLRPEGTLYLLTSRYFMEAEGAEGLREFISGTFQVDEMTDLYGQRVASWPGVDLVLLTLKKTGKRNPTAISRIKNPDTRGIREKQLLESLKERDARLFYFYESRLPAKGKWRTSPPEFSPYLRAQEKILEEGGALFQTADSFQGIITGCDEAFIRKDGVEDALARFPVRDWVKSREILHETVGVSQKKIIYISKNDILTSEEELALAPYKEKLVKRREVRNGRIPWWALQWEREIEKFNETKIIWPYKAERNAFFVDDEGRCFSADVYGMRVHDSPWNVWTLAALLNTPFYDCLFKLAGKKLGGRLYEYYPHSVMNLPVPEFYAFHEKVRKVLEKGGQKRSEALLAHAKGNRLCDKIYKLNAGEQKALTALYDCVLREIYL